MAVSPTSIHWNTRHLPCFLCLFTVPKHMCTSLSLQIASFANKVVNDSSMAKVNLCEQNIFTSPPSESFDLVWNIGTPHSFPKSASLLAIKWCSIVWAWRDNYNYLISTTNCKLTYRRLAVARPPIAAMLARLSLPVWELIHGGVSYLRCVTRIWVDFKDITKCKWSCHQLLGFFLKCDWSLDSIWFYYRS